MSGARIPSPGAVVDDCRSPGSVPRRGSPTRVIAGHIPKDAWEGAARGRSLQRIISALAAALLPVFNAFFLVLIVVSICEAPGSRRIHDDVSISFG